MRAQLDMLGLSFDWQHEVDTSSPAYYKWTQWLFLQLYRHGLAYQKESVVNWDPVDETVLANEQVDAQGRSWRSGAFVVKRRMRQWFLAITRYAPALLSAIDTDLAAWPLAVRKMQREWIGERQGTRVRFALAPHPDVQDRQPAVEVFTTRVDTLLGVSFVAIAPEHELLPGIVPPSHFKDIDHFINTETPRFTNQQRAQSKAGLYTGRDVIHPLTGARVPLYVVHYVLPDYATGAVMGVPAHDSRDFDFATRYNLPVTRVIANPNAHANAAEAPLPLTTEGVLVNSGKYDGLSSAEARAVITQDLVAQGLGRASSEHSLRDWLVSRQRYWGCPVPMIHCPACGVVPVPESDLPVELPKDVEMKGKGSPLASHVKWRSCSCPQCGGPAQRDPDTLDTFVDSSWYFLRYADARNDAEPWSQAAIKRRFPVNVYVGGIEHAILHLLYARFITRVLHELQLVPGPEPFAQLRTQGMVRVFPHFPTLIVFCLTHTHGHFS